MPLRHRVWNKSSSLQFHTTENIFFLRNVFYAEFRACDWRFSQKEVILLVLVVSLDQSQGHFCPQGQKCPRKNDCPLLIILITGSTTNDYPHHSLTKQLYRNQSFFFKERHHSTGPSSNNGFSNKTTTATGLHPFARQWLIWHQEAWRPFFNKCALWHKRQQRKFYGHAQIKQSLGIAGIIGAADVIIWHSWAITTQWASRRRTAGVHEHIGFQLAE